jgi:5-formyltetrahydrofolate cyclo-ligase
MCYKIDQLQGFQNAKREMRERVRAMRDAMAPDVRALASRACVNALTAMPMYQGADVILTYMSFGSEIDTHALLDRMIADGKTVLAPRIDRESNALALHRVQSPKTMVQGVWGIVQPTPSAEQRPIADVDLAILPGLAFDRKGGRLGYGAGYYDRLLAHASPAMPRIAMAFDCQLVEQVPFAPHDMSVDLLITPTETIRCPRSFG